MVGTCIGLFLLALVDRWISACRSVMEAHWSKRCVYCLRLPRSPHPYPFRFVVSSCQFGADWC